MRKYILVWLSSLGDVEELCYNEFKKYVYKNYLEDCDKLNNDVEMRDVGNGLISYLSDEWIIIEDVFVDYDEQRRLYVRWIS